MQIGELLPFIGLATEVHVFDYDYELLFSGFGKHMPTYLYSRNIDFVHVVDDCLVLYLEEEEDGTE